jgi:hypothetical protein
MGQPQAADGLGDVGQRVRPGVPVVRRVGELPDPAGIQDDDGGPAADQALLGFLTFSERSSGRKTSASTLRKLSASE